MQTNRTQGRRKRGRKSAADKTADAFGLNPLMTDEDSAARARERLARIRHLYRRVLDSNRLEGSGDGKQNDPAHTGDNDAHHHECEPNAEGSHTPDHY